MDVCSVCVFQSTLTARFPLCQSVAAMEHPGLARPSISRLPWLSAFTDTHTHTLASTLARSLMSLHKPLTALSSEKTKATRYFIKRLQLLCMWAQNKNRIFFFSPKIQRSQQVMLILHFLNFSACHTQLIAIWRA